MRAAEDTDDPEYEESARVARISLLSGEVSLRRAGNTNWEKARLNLPLVEGDTLTTGRDARLEIQIDARNFVRVAADSVLHVVTLRDEGVALSLAEGTATLRLARFTRDKEYFEIDAPQTTIAAEKPGLYRLDVTRDGGVRVTVRGDGRARIYSETSGFTLREGRSAQLVTGSSKAGDWELSAAQAFDQWDTWVDERDRYLASRLRFEERDRYYDANVWGAEELDSYGDWSHTKDYGWVWRPHITVINRYNNWAPYRYGHWSWVPPYGWTWVGDEEWGWAPYHHGRWVHYDNNWCWAPRGYGYNHRRSWWRPALVAFVYIPTSYGEHVAWYPLRPGQHDPRGRRWQQQAGRLTPLRGNEITRLERTNPAYLRAVTTVPVRDFGTGAGLRARPATTDVARRAFTGEPVRGRLPITPADSGRSVTTEGNGRARLNIIRPSPVAPARPLPERPTGAAARTPGVALDSELRRSRVFRGRAPRTPSTDNNGSGTEAVERGTGAIFRPAERSPIERGVRRRNSEDAPVVTRPARPDRSDAPAQVAAPSDAQPNSAPREGRPERRVRRGTDEPSDGSNSNEAPRPIERRARPAAPPDENRSVPTPYYRPERRERSPESIERQTPQTEERPAPHEERVRPARPERTEPRPERSEPRYERPAPRREEAPIRQEP
ncbi:MAG: FecR domain-containing protein, partial [Acidobacteriota bacterium]|nr:FecR domain-containing protein [Acidobacteriota bacterium]